MTYLRKSAEVLQLSALSRVSALHIFVSQNYVKHWISLNTYVNHYSS
jgi:hypothetical protein